jgi:hypothetical protein
MKRLALVSATIIALFSCKKDTAPQKQYQECPLQYSVNKWLKYGDTMVVAVCKLNNQEPIGPIDSVVLEYMPTYDASRMLLMSERWSYDFDVFKLDRNYSGSVNATTDILRCRIMQDLGHAILLNVRYNTQ